MLEFREKAKLETCLVGGKSRAQSLIHVAYQISEHASGVPLIISVYLCEANSTTAEERSEEASRDLRRKEMMEAQIEECEARE